MGRVKITPEMDARMCKMRRKGMKQEDIAIFFGCSTDAVQRRTRHIKVHKGGRHSGIAAEIEEESAGCWHGNPWAERAVWIGNRQRQETVGPCQCWRQRQKVMKAS